MFAWKEKRDIQSQVKKLSTAHAGHDGANRRAIGLLPVPHAASVHEIAHSNSLRFHELLVSIEGKQSTCCLRIVSPKARSRSAILVFRGRVLGCLYGNKSMSTQLFGQEAHQHAMSDLAHPDNILDAYLLSEELVIAAASLFHGTLMNFPNAKTPEQVFEEACETLMRSDMPGCVAINTADNLAVCMVYIFGGKIIGCYSYKDGWVETCYETGLKYIAQTGRTAKVMASMLPARNVSEVNAMTFSLTGLGDQKERQYGASNLYEGLMDPEGEELRTALQLRQRGNVNNTNDMNFNPRISGNHPVYPVNHSGVRQHTSQSQGFMIRP